MMKEHEVKAAFRANGAPKMSGYGIKRFYRKVSEKLPPEHKGHRVTGMVKTDGKEATVYACSCGASILVRSRG